MDAILNVFLVLSLSLAFGLLLSLAWEVVREHRRK